ncbi:NAD(P)-binding protein [Aspergillus californicus]
MLSSSDYALLPGSLILVTGANGYIASHVIDILLSKGYNVRGTIRNEKPWLDKYFSEKYGSGRFESVIVPALDDSASWDNGNLDNVAGVLHIASDLSFRSNPSDVIPWMREATIHLLEAAERQKTVKRFVITSSAAAVIIPVAHTNGISVDETTWNERSVKAAWDDSTPATDRPYHIYAAAKIAQERAAWEFVKEKQPGFELNVVIPNSAYGRILLPEITNSSMHKIGTVLMGNDRIVRSFCPQWFVNVEDVARLHVIALLDPAVKGERIFGFASRFNWTDIISIMRKLRPDNRVIPNPPENEGRDQNVIVCASRAEGLLREFFDQPGWITLEQSIADGIEGM